jgi:molybdopterin-biosynthesis enzyme MoeA-like protein
MGDKCCGGSGKRKGFGVYTHQYEQNVEMSHIRESKLSEILSKIPEEERMFINYKLNKMNKISSEILSSNHLLRSKIFDLESEIELMNIKVKLVRESATLQDAKRATYFPRESQFTRIDD